MDLSTKMDEGNVPDEGRFLNAPPWVVGMLQKNSAFISAQSNVVLNGAVGQVAGINILKSNDVVTTGTTPVVYHMVAGVADAWAFAQQIANVEAIRLEGSFADGVRGLHLYGANILNSTVPLFTAMLAGALPWFADERLGPLGVTGRPARRATPSVGSTRGAR